MAKLRLCEEAIEIHAPTRCLRAEGARRLPIDSRRAILETHVLYGAVIRSTICPRNLECARTAGRESPNRNVIRLSALGSGVIAGKGDARQGS